MRKTEVETSYHRGTEGLPMVDVKVHRWTLTGAELDSLRFDFPFLADLGYAELRETIAERSDALPWLFGAACEAGWEDAREDAAELFGDGVTVYAAGRSGGWLVLSGLDPVEAWDAIALGRWAKFARWARDTADGTTYTAAWLLCANVLQPEHDAAEAEAAEDAAGELPVLVTL